MLVHPLASEVPGAVTEGAVRVQKCTEAEDEIWADTIMRGFSEHFVVSEENQLILKSLFRRPDSTCLLAWLEGRPAGGGALALHEGIAALYGASTLPSFRRRGVQRAVINALLHVAIEGGCDIAYTLTKPGSASQRNMERQHFRVAYTRVAMIRES
jgi:GNAT superfamily N-acetyltransferase